MKENEIAYKKLYDKCGSTLKDTSERIRSYRQVWDNNGKTIGTCKNISV